MIFVRVFLHCCVVVLLQVSTSAQLPSCCSSSSPCFCGCWWCGFLLYHDLALGKGLGNDAQKSLVIEHGLGTVSSHLASDMRRWNPTRLRKPTIKTRIENCCSRLSPMQYRRVLVCTTRVATSLGRKLQHLLQKFAWLVCQDPTWNALYPT